MKYSIKDIKNEIKQENKIYYFKITLKKNYLIAKGHKKTETKDIIETKINSKINKYENSIIYRFTIKFHNNNNNNNTKHGTISIHLSSYLVKNGRLKKNDEYGKVGLIWFKENWLIYNGWDKQYIIEIMDLIKSEKSKIISPGINYYPI